VKTNLEIVADLWETPTGGTLLHAYGAWVAGSRGPMSREAWWLAYRTATVRKLERLGLTEMTDGEDEWGWRVLSQRGRVIARLLLRRCEDTYGKVPAE
jgi:hypothetical protein